MTIEAPDLDLSTELPIVNDLPVTDEVIAAWATADEPVDADSVWRIEDQENADKAGRRWARADEQLDELASQRDTLLAEIAAAQAAQVAKVEAWYSATTAAPERNRAFFARTLETYMERVRADSNDKTKSVRLPSVRLRSKVKNAYAVLAGSGKAETDAASAEVVGWLRTLGDAATEAITHVPAVDKPAMAKVKRLVEVVDGRVVDPSTGEVVPGLDVVPAATTVELDRNDGDA